MTDDKLQEVRELIRNTMPPVHCESCYLHKPGNYTRKDCVTYGKRECAYETIYIDQILSIPDLCINSPDQRLPDNPYFFDPKLKTMNTGHAMGLALSDEKCKVYEQAQQDMLAQGWVKVINKWN